MIWQMMVALWHANGQLRTERYGDREKGYQKPAVQQKTTDDIAIATLCYYYCCLQLLFNQRLLEVGHGVENWRFSTEIAVYLRNRTR